MAKKRGHGEGTIYRRSNGTYRAQIWIDGEHPGKTFKTKYEAQVWLNEVKVQLHQGWDYNNSRQKLGDYLNQWLDGHQIELRDRTIYRYKQLIRVHINPYIGKIQLNDLHLAQIEKYYGELNNQGVGKRTIREVHGVLHVALEKAVKYKYILTNPTEGASLPRYKRSKVQVLDESEVSRFLGAAINSKYNALYHVALKTGMRQGELFGLQWSDLKWYRGILYVTRQVQRIPRQGWKFTDPKTDAGIRNITLGEGTLQVLREHNETQQIAKVVAGERWKEYDLIFPSSVGTPLHTGNLLKDFYKTLEDAGLKKITFHGLRHTTASLMLNHGIPVIKVSKILGHEKVSTTLDIYGHLINGEQEDMTRLMDELLTPTPVDITGKSELITTQISGSSQDQCN